MVQRTPDLTTLGMSGCNARHSDLMIPSCVHSKHMPKSTSPVEATASRNTPLGRISLNKCGEVNVSN